MGKSFYLHFSGITEAIKKKKLINVLFLVLFHFDFYNVIHFEDRTQSTLVPLTEKLLSHWTIWRQYLDYGYKSRRCLERKLL